VDPVPDPLLLIKSGSAGNRTRTYGSVARNSDHQTTQTFCVCNTVRGVRTLSELCVIEAFRLSFLSASFTRISLGFDIRDSEHCSVSASITVTSLSGDFHFILQQLTYYLCHDELNSENCTVLTGSKIWEKLSSGNVERQKNSQEPVPAPGFQHRTS
jgi:hypothetical protein